MLDIPFTPISSTIKVASTNISMVRTEVAIWLNLSALERKKTLNIGLPRTPGEIGGEKMATSESRLENAELKRGRGHVNQMFES